MRKFPLLYSPSWEKIGRMLRRKINHQRVEPLSARYLSDKGLNPEVARAVANATLTAMARRIGVDPFVIATDSWLKEDITRECTKCKDRGRCRLWLADYAADDDGYTEFCPNADRFRKLM